ncbi:MAG: DHH family phosphoesterase [Candidatus Nomurabacteria bacterium]|nr:DHH family phosphoesterase [Candidatus Nomurabacteria bacterium]
MNMNEKVTDLIAQAHKVIIIQAENADGDSIGSAVALEAILEGLGKDVALYCPVQVPTYLRYIDGWDRISDEFDLSADLAIIVDTTSKVLLSKTLDQSAVSDWFGKHPVIAIDHHASVEPDLPFEVKYMISDIAVATGEMVYDLARENDWLIDAAAASGLYISIQADTLGLTTETVGARQFEICAELIKLGANPAELEGRRRELSRKSQRILHYKGELLDRIEYHADNRLALVKVPFEEIAKYSNEYNPTMLVLDEMRLVVGVDVAIGTKTYPDGKFTAKIRSNVPVADQIAGFFGGGGHKYAAGFRIYEEDVEKAENELIGAVDRVLLEYDKGKTADVA